MSTYVEANNKPSEVHSKRTNIRVHLLPAFGELCLDHIGQRQIEEFKARQLQLGLARKSVNNHLCTLRRILAVAVEWEVIDHVPKFKWLKCPETKFDFLNFEEAERLVIGADGEWRTMIVVGLPRWTPKTGQ